MDTIILKLIICIKDVIAFNLFDYPNINVLACKSM